MRAVWSAQAWRLGLTLQQLRREVRQLAADLRTVGWCQLRGAHFLEPDPFGGDHSICTACAWCEDCRERLPDVLEGEQAEPVLP